MVDPSTLASLLLAGVAAGLAGAVAMEVPMGRHPEGWTPAFVAAGVLRRTGPESVRFRDASVVHHVAGVAAGVLYALLAAPLVSVLDGTPQTPGVSTLPIGAHLAATTGVAVFVYAFFVYVVLPRTGAVIPDDRTTAVRGQWARSTVVFGVVLGVVAPVVVWAAG